MVDKNISIRDPTLIDPVETLIVGWVLSNDLSSESHANDMNPKLTKAAIDGGQIQLPSCRNRHQVACLSITFI